MRTPPRQLGLVISIIVAGLVGFAIGRFSHAPTLPPVISVAAVREGKAAIAAQSLIPSAEPVRDAGSASAARLESIAWLNRNGISVFMPVIAMKRVDPKFALLFDLTPTETTTLNSAIDRASQQMDELENLHASGEIDAAAGKLNVEVVPFPEEGGAVYNELLAQFRKVLGPGRFSHFNSNFGDAFDQYFDGFGLNRLKYEVNLKPAASQNGNPIYRYKRYFSTPDGQGYGQGEGMFILQDLIEHHPALRRFMPQSASPNRGGSS